MNSNDVMRLGLRYRIINESRREERRVVHKTKHMSLLHPENVNELMLIQQLSYPSKVIFFERKSSEKNPMRKKSRK